MDLSKHFDRIVVVNLDRRPDRWAEITVELQKWGITGAERVAAIDGNNLPPHPHISPGALGLVMTTISIVREAKEKNLKNVLILEDDVYFRESLNDIDEYMNNVPEDWGLLYLGAHHIQKPRRISDKIGRVVQAFTTHSFAVNACIFDMILSDLSGDLNKLPFQIDLYFSELQKKVSAYCFIPSMTGQRSSFSDVENRFTDYTDNMDENLIFNNPLPKRFLTVAIPCYEMSGRGAEFLKHSLQKLTEQTYRDFNVVVSDHSGDAYVESVVNSYRDKLDLLYVLKEYERDNPSSNVNNAIRHSNGDYIKILFQDDFLYDRYALQHTVNAINANKGCNWLVSACEHSNDGETFYRPFYPAWNDKINDGVNTISSPSVLTIKNVGDKVFFDLNLIWLMDCDYYYRCYLKYGLPVFISDITVVNRTWQNQLTNLLNDEDKNKELDIIKRKYEVPA